MELQKGNKMKKSMESGRSMLEMMGVLAIIGVLSVGGFGMMTKMSNSRKTNAIMDEIGALASKTRGIVREYDEADGYSGMGGFLVQSRAYPSEVEWDSTHNYFVGTDDVTYTVNKSTTDLFEIEVAGVTAETCMEIVSANWGSVGTNGFVKLTVGNKTSSVPLGVGEASDACNDDASIKLTYR